MAEPDDFGTMVGGVLAGTAVVFVSLASLPVTLPLAVGYAGVAAANDQPSLKAQASITLTMEGTAVTRLMGQPTAALRFEPAHTTVWYYERWTAPALWVGLDGDRVSWLRFGHPDPWLRAVTDRLREGQRGSG